MTEGAGSLDWPGQVCLGEKPAGRLERDRTGTTNWKREPGPLALPSAPGPCRVRDVVLARQEAQLPGGLQLTHRPGRLVGPQCVHERGEPERLDSASAASQSVQTRKMEKVPPCRRMTVMFELGLSSSTKSSGGIASQTVSNYGLDMSLRYYVAGNAGKRTRSYAVGFVLPRPIPVCLHIFALAKWTGLFGCREADPLFASSFAQSRSIRRVVAHIEPFRPDRLSRTLRPADDLCSPKSPRATEPNPGLLLLLLRAASRPTQT